MSAKIKESKTATTLMCPLLPTSIVEADLSPWVFITINVRKRAGDDVQGPRASASCKRASRGPGKPHYEV